MKAWIVFLLAISVQNFGFAHSIDSLPLDLTGQELRQIFEKERPHNKSKELDLIIQVGTRNLDWLKYINQFQPDGQKLSFSSKETQTNIPITAPRKMNEQIVVEAYNKLISEMPAEMTEVLIGGKDFTQKPPIDVKAYLFWGLKMDRSYQSATRWTLLQPYLTALAARRSNDVRGYYFLSRLENREEKFKNYQSLTDQEKADIKFWLVLMCVNNGSSFAGCESTIATAISTAKLSDAYKGYESKSKNLYDSYFLIPALAARKDVVFTSSNPNLTTVPFIDPKNSTVLAFLQDNIQDEWRFDQWALKLTFVNSGPHAYVEFKPGVTPNVNGLGGNKITMDANSPLDEYNVQWTIRHEYGHVLGLPDCYLEFYEPENKVIVNYQIDVENLMCARTGHIQKGHVDEMKRVYFKN